MPRPQSILAAVTPGEMSDFLPEPLLTAVREIAPMFTHLDTTDLTIGKFHEALAALNPEVLVACWKTPALPAALPPALRYVAYLSGSIRQLISRAHVEQGLLVTNWGGSISRVVAEGALLHILSCLRRSRQWMQVMHHEGGWKGKDRADKSLFGRRVGIHGFGNVARELVALLRPFGCAISAFAPDVGAAVETAWQVKSAASLEALFSGNDIVVELAPLIPETTGIVDERLLRLIPHGGVFVNVGRGAVVEAAALVSVARDGNVLFGLDVFDGEPLPADSPLRSMRNVALTPHVAGPTRDRFRDAGEFMLGNLRAYRDDLSMQALFTPEGYDRVT